MADIRTGSTLLSTSLDRDPRIRCYGELFHPTAFPDNRPPGVDAARAGAGDMVRAVLGPPGARAAGFRAMVFLPLEDQQRWTDAWDVIIGIPGLRVIFLERPDRLAQYASARIAQTTGAFHPSPGDDVLDPDRRPTIRVDAGRFRAWCRERDHLMALRRDALRGRPALELTYDDLAGAWERTIARVQRFLGLEPVPIAQSRDKQEKRPLSEVILNWDELASAGLAGRTA